jgi:hypothetical protein
MATCIARQKAVCVNSLAAPGTGATAASTQSCADAYANWSCADWVNNVPPTACATQAGTRTTGQACEFNGQCSTKWCLLPTGARCGTCADLPTVGSSCATSGCGSGGLYCDAVSRTCQPLVTTAGSQCDAGSCGFGFGCVIPKDGGSSSCQALATTAGAACDLLQQTAPSCASYLGLSCYRFVCHQELFASAGATCGLDRDAGVTTRCQAGAQCESDAGVSTCVAAAADDAGCNTGAGIDCLPFARCVSSDGLGDGGPVVGTCTVNSAASCQ